VHGPRLSTPPLPGGFGFPLGFVTTIIVTFAAVAAGATTRPVWSLAALVGTTGSVACVSTLGAAVATATVAWALQAGFVLGRHGDLALTQVATRDAIAFLTAALFAFIVATAIRAIRDRVRPAMAHSSGVSGTRDVASSLNRRARPAEDAEPPDKGHAERYSVSA
jgi:hypothetical protein